MSKLGVKSDILIAVVFLLPLFCTAALAQTRFMDEYVSVDYSMDDGMPSNYVDDICRDSSGFLWIATSGGGLCRFDGYDFLVFSSATSVRLKSNFVRNVCEDRFNRLWVGTEGGIDVIDLKTVQLSSLSHPSLAAAFSARCTFMTTDSAGNIWIKSADTIYKVVFDSDGGVSRVLSFADPEIARSASVFEDVESDGSVWLPLQGRIFRLSENASPELSLTPVLPSLSFEDNTYVSDFLVVDSQVWISTENGLYRIQAKSGEWKSYVHDSGDANSLTQNFITSLAVTSDHSIVASSLYGFNVYNPISDNFERVGSDFINCSRAYDDILLLGSESTGLHIYSPRQLSVTNHVHSSDPRSIAPGPVNSFMIDPDGRLWVGNVEGGLSIMEPGGTGFSHLTVSSAGLSHNSVSAIERAGDGNIYVGTWGGGVNVLQGRPPYRVSGVLSDSEAVLDYVGVLHYDSRNRLLWIGANSGIYIYDTAGRSISPALDVQTSGCIGSCEDSSGKLWIGSLDGLYIFDLKNRTSSGSFEYVNYRYRLDDPDSGVLEKICCISEAADGTIWLGSNGGGIYKAAPDGSGGYVFQSWTRSLGLSNDQVRGICEDHSGRIWVASVHGLDCLDPASGSVARFDRTNGLGGIQFYWNAASLSPEGLLYLGHTGGLSVVDPSVFRSGFSGAALRLTSVTVGDEVRRGPFISSLSLHERDRSLVIEFALPGIPTADQIRYEYMLDGYDKLWNRVPDRRHEVAYSSLPHGDYVLHIKAFSPFGDRLDELDLPLEVRPFFYKTWWFMLLCAGLGLATVFYVLRRRTISLERQKTELERLVDERTEEISEQKKLVELKAEELAERNRMLQRQNEEMAGQRILYSQENRPSDTPRDEKFVAKALDVVRASYKDSDLDVAAFCSAMGMSKTLLNKRMQETIGQSVGQFIRTYRLSVARQMLIVNRESRNMNISEIAYESGFNDPKYFTRCFTKEFGVSPSSFINE